jgi:hypothetical protein
MAVELGTPIRAFRGKPAKRLTNDTKQKRLQFCKANKGRSWANMMFTDRKKFLFSYPGAKVRAVEWIQVGATRQAACVNHPQCVNIYAGISKYGVTKCHIVAGSSKTKTSFVNKKGQTAKNITSSEYQHVLKDTLLPGGKLLFSVHGTSCWVLQQDNDPTHRVATDIVKEWSKDHASNVSLLNNWPPNSPDLSPIENVWSYVQGKVNSLGCTTFDQFKVAVVAVFQAVPKRMLINLYNSMPKRLAKVIELDGDKTSY